MRICVYSSSSTLWSTQLFFSKKMFVEKYWELSTSLSPVDTYWYRNQRKHFFYKFYLFILFYETNFPRNENFYSFIKMNIVTLYCPLPRFTRRVSWMQKWIEEEDSKPKKNVNEEDRISVERSLASFKYLSSLLTL